MSDPYDDIDFRPHPGDWFKLARRFPMRRRRHFSNPKKGSTKWCRQFFFDSMKDESNLVVGDGLVLCPITTAIDSQADIVVKTVRVVGSIFRLAVSDVDLRCMWIMASQKFDVATGNALQVVNPFDELALSSQDIMGFGFLPIPPVVLLPSTDAPAVNRQSFAFDIHVKAKRKLNRNTNTIMLTFATQGTSTADGIARVTVATSLLMEWK